MSQQQAVDDQRRRLGALVCFVFIGWVVFVVFFAGLVDYSQTPIDLANRDTSSLLADSSRDMSSRMAAPSSSTISFMSRHLAFMRAHSCSALLYQKDTAFLRVLMRWSEWQVGKKHRYSIMRSRASTFSSSLRFSINTLPYFYFRDQSVRVLIWGWLCLDRVSNSMRIFASNSSASISYLRQQLGCSISNLYLYSLQVRTRVLISSSFYLLSLASCSLVCSSSYSSRISRLRRRVTAARLSWQKGQGGGEEVCSAERAAVLGVVFLCDTVNSLIMRVWSI